MSRTADLIQRALDTMAADPCDCAVHRDSHLLTEALDAERARQADPVGLEVVTARILDSLNGTIYRGYVAAQLASLPAQAVEPNEGEHRG